jgi:hypothetical protein
LLLIAACLVLTSWIYTAQAVAQDTGAAPTAQRAPMLKAENGLVFQEAKLGMLLISGKVYQMEKNAVLYSMDGKRIHWSNLKANDVVDIQYLTGGSKTEEYPYSPKARVLTSLRVVAKGKK